LKYIIYATEKFTSAKDILSIDEKKQVIKAVAMLQENPRHPGLRTKKIKGKSNILECRVNQDIRILWKYQGNIIILLLVGRHNIVEF
jgi:mRNA interferase RelE/StbE